MCRLTLSVLSLAVLVACQPATPELTDEQRAAIADTVNAIHAEAWDVWRAADLDRGMEIFHDSPDLLFALEGQLIHGFASIRDAFAPTFEGVASQAITIEESQSMVLAPDVVCVTERGTFASTDTAGVTGPEATFALTVVYVRRSGAWKAMLGHESFPTPESM
jgi:uncharacterized protein (TIGR02246 family)